MNFVSGNIYHIYNRSNNKELLFYSRDNYIYFLRKIRTYILPHCEIMAYCLMPNHFHFLIYINEKVERDDNLLFSKNKLSEGFRLLLSSYTKGINKQRNRKGNLFQQNTKSKCINEFIEVDYATICFHYIHQNPKRAGIVDKFEDWEFSSFNDYAGIRSGTLINKKLANQFLNINHVTFYKDSYDIMIAESHKQHIY